MDTPENTTDVSAIAEERPPWLPQNFRSGEDLARSYREAQGALTRKSQEASALSAELDVVLAEVDRLREERASVAAKVSRIEQAVFQKGAG